MTSDIAELSALSATLDEVTARLTSMAERRSQADNADQAAAALFAIERALREASRRLTKLVTTMGRGL